MLEGIIRESNKKSYTSGLRRDGYLIANIYGKGVENINAAFKVNDFIRFVKNKPNLAFDVKVGGKVVKVIIQEYQKDPVKTEFLHVDMLAVTPGHETYYQVPVRYEGTPIGFKNKGVLVTHRRRIKVKCKAEDLPNEYVLDISNLDVNDAILVRDMDLGKNVQTFLNPSIPVVGIVKAK